MLTKTDSSGAILEELNSSGELTNSLMSKILYEGTRPIVGALGGAYSWSNDCWCNNRKVSQ